MSTILPHMAWP